MTGGFAVALPLNSPSVRQISWLESGTQTRYLIFMRFLIQNIQPENLFFKFIAGFGIGVFLSASLRAQPADGPVNLAVAAVASSSSVSGDTSLAALNDGYAPRNSSDNRRGAYGNWPSTGTQWVEYDWSQPVSTKQIEAYWWADRQGVHLPAGCRVKFWDGNGFVEITNATGLGVEGDKFNVTTLAEVTTS